MGRGAGDARPMARRRGEGKVPMEEVLRGSEVSGGMRGERWQREGEKMSVRWWERSNSR